MSASAARWNTQSVPASIASSRASLARSTRSKEKRGSRFRWARFSGRPVEKSSSTSTEWPSARRRSTTWLPMNPAPPVTTVFMQKNPSEKTARIDLTVPEIYASVPWRRYHWARIGRDPHHLAPALPSGGARDLGGQLDLVADEADEPEQHQHPDHDPRGVELQTAHAELGAGRIRVVVVVQALATGEPREYSEVGGGVGEEVLATGPV